LVDALRRAEYEVTILFLLGCHPTDGNISEWVDHYRDKKGVNLIPLPIEHHPRIHAAWASSVSYHTYVWLKEHQEDFDIIHFPECQGLGFYSLLARRQGLAFRKTTFVIGTHGPTFWVKEGSQDYIRNLGELEIDYMERVSVAAADVVVSPSTYLLGWMRDNDWQLPERTFIAPYIRPTSTIVDQPETAAPREIREIVFFGRLEIRKGLKLLCDALDELSATPGTPPFEVSFLGKETMIYGRSSIGYISDRSKKWPMRWQIIGNKFQAEAIDYLRRPGRLAVVASLADNYPNTALECLSAGVPLLATNVGGIPEIIAPEDRDTVCFDPRPEILALRIREALLNGVAPARPSVAVLDNERRWVNWHRSLHPQAEQEANVQEAWPEGTEIFPRVSICLPYNVWENGVAATLASLDDQDYPDFEIILVKCGGAAASAASEPVQTAAGRAIRWLYQASPELGAGRNLAAQHAQGEYLLFLDDHSILLPASLSTFIHIALRTKAEIVTSALSFFIGSPNGRPEDRLEHSRRPFLGADIATGAFTNGFGSPNALISHRAFTALGGFSSEAVTTLDEWEFYAKAALRDISIETTPEVLLWHREDPDQESLVHSLMNAMRSVRPYTAPGSDHSPTAKSALRKVMQFGQGLKFEQDALLGSPLSRGEQGPAVTG
jgi:glycosyltransferase involved in cell wall biosynthesis/GT2 family glycosyltransferase